MTSNIVQTTDVDSSRQAEGEFETITYNEVAHNHISADLLKEIEAVCFRENNKSCAIDISTRQLQPVDYDGVAFTINGLIVQQRWAAHFCDWIPIFFIRHVHFPKNLAYHFGDIPSLQTHSNVFRWKHNADAEQYYVYYRNMIMPVPKPNDLIFDFIKTKTTPAPPSAKSTIPPSTVTPKPVVPITRDSAKANEVDERDYTDEPTVETTVDEDYLITDELIYEDASYALMVPFVCIGIGMMVLLG